MVSGQLNLEVAFWTKSLIGTMLLMIHPLQEKIESVDHFLWFGTSQRQRNTEVTLPTEVNAPSQSLEPLGPAWD